MSYRASAKKGSRKGGDSASAKHAYHQREHGYAVGLDGPREDLAATGSGNLPSWTGGNPALFWDATDSYERANGTLFRDLQLNLAAELNLEQNQQVVEAYAQRMFGVERLPYSWAIHIEDDTADLNQHVHLMVSERMTDDVRRTAETHFKRHNSAKPEACGALKTRTLKPKSWLMEARAAWAEEVNNGLVAAGYAPRFDHRSKEDQREAAFMRCDLRRVAELSTLTQEHEGPRISGMRRRVEAGKCELAKLPEYAQDVIQANDAIREQNAVYLSLLESLDDSQLVELLADELIERLHTEALALNEVFDAHCAAAKLASAQARIDTLEKPLATPPEVAKANKLRAACDAAKTNLPLAKAAEKKTKEASDSWHQEHKIKSALGLSSKVDADLKAATTAREDLETAVYGYRDAPERLVAMAWSKAKKAVEAELKSLHEQLPGLQKAADEARANAYPYEVLAEIERQSEQLEQLGEPKTAHDLLEQAKAAADAGDGRALLRLRSAGHEVVEHAEAQLIEREEALINEAHRDLKATLRRIENQLMSSRDHSERSALFKIRGETEAMLKEARQWRSVLAERPALTEIEAMRNELARRVAEIKEWGVSLAVTEPQPRAKHDSDSPAPEHKPRGPR